MYYVHVSMYVCMYVYVCKYVCMCVYVSIMYVYIQGAAEWTPTFLKVTGKGLVVLGRRGRWQQFGRIV